MNSPRHGKQHRPSTWSRARHDLASPQGFGLMIGLLLCFLFTVAAIILESYLNVPKSVISVGLLTSYAVILTVVMYKIIARNKREAKARREAYREKFERKSGLY